MTASLLWLSLLAAQPTLAAEQSCCMALSSHWACHWQARLLVVLPLMPVKRVLELVAAPALPAEERTASMHPPEG